MTKARRLRSRIVDLVEMYNIDEVKCKNIQHTTHNIQYIIYKTPPLTQYFENVEITFSNMSSLDTFALSY